MPEQGPVASYAGRPPTADDLIVPDFDTMAARSQSMATKDDARAAKALGIYVPKRGTHALRRFYIWACRGVGADRDMVRLDL